MKKPLNMMYLGNQFVFICILVRGSCQAAYAEFIYPTIGFVLVNLMLKRINFDFLIAEKSPEEENTPSAASGNPNNGPEEPVCLVKPHYENS